MADAAPPLASHERQQGWDNLPELPVDVGFLLRAQVRLAEELPCRLPGIQRPSLATVYVRQGLGHGSEDLGLEQQQPVPILDERGQLITSERRPTVRVAIRPSAGGAVGDWHDIGAAKSGSRPSTATPG